MTKLFKHEPKLGDRFRLNSGEIVKFAVLLPETLGATHRLIAVKKNGRVLPYHYPSGKYYEEDTSVPLDMPSQQDDWIMHTTDELALRKCAYWVSLRGLPDTTNKESVSINIPAANAFSPQALNDLMQKADRREDL